MFNTALNNYDIGKYAFTPVNGFNFLLTYDDNGLEIENIDELNKDIYYTGLDTCILEEPIYDTEKYIFSGWLVEDTLYAVGDTLKFMDFNKDIVAVAKWEEKKEYVNIEIDGNGGYIKVGNELKGNCTIEIEKGKSFNLSDINTRYEGYKLIGWRLNGVEYGISDTILNVKENIKLVAKWEKNPENPNPDNPSPTDPEEPQIEKPDDINKEGDTIKLPEQEIVDLNREKLPLGTQETDLVELEDEKTPLGDGEVKEKESEESQNKVNPKTGIINKNIYIVAGIAILGLVFFLYRKSEKVTN